MNIETESFLFLLYACFLSTCLVTDWFPMWCAVLSLLIILLTWYHLSFIDYCYQILPVTTPSPFYMDALTPQDRTHFKRGYSEIMQRRLHCTYLTIKVSFSSLSYVSSPPLVHLDVFDTEPTIFTPLCFSLTEDRLIITTEVPYTPSLEKSTTRHTSITETTNLLLSYGTPPTKWCRDLYNTIQYNTPSMHYFACRYIYVYYMMSLSSGTQCWFYTLHMCPHRAKEWNNEFEDKLWNDL